MVYTSGNGVREVEVCPNFSAEGDIPHYKCCKWCRYVVDGAVEVEVFYTPV